MKMLNNKVVVVTGGKGLLGSAILKELSSHGAICINADIGCEKKISSGEYFCDITKEESVKELVAEVVKHHNKIDGWINNAYPRTSDWGKLSFSEESMANWQKNVDSHLCGYAICSQVALNQMKTQKSGSLINMSSIYGILGPDFTVYEGTSMNNPSAYSAIKGGIVNLTRYLASYYGKSNVRVNCISPGGIFDNQPSVFVENYNKKTPLNRMGLPGDIAPSVAFLISDGASYITGQNLVIDGGWSIV
ncbi:MAG: short-chain dehydrogenase/reductase [Bacteroidetes bacterium]|nr:short-chain dehydrogenase/reductase [Bacteroidota bacterium]